MKVGLLIIATNKYIEFLQPLITSADKWFLNGQEVTYFVFTNQNIEIETNRKVIMTHVEHKSWPWMTLGRYHIFSNNKDLFSDIDYLYYCDADMLFVGEVGNEILGDLVATQHHGFFEKRGTPETNPKSLACVYPNENMQYFCGGFNGGSCKEYLKMSEQISHNIDIDFKNDIIAIWHDESHINRYFIDNRPTKILSPSYCYHQAVTHSPFERKILALTKNNNIR